MYLFFPFLSYRSSPFGSSAGPTEATRNDDPAEHQNEGFLRSMWHNLTNNPAHRAANENHSSDGKNDSDSSKKDSNSR